MDPDFHTPFLKEISRVGYVTFFKKNRFRWNNFSV